MSMGDEWVRPDEPLENARLAARRRVVVDEEIDRRLRRRLYWWVALGAIVLVILGILAYRSWYVTPDPDPALVGAIDVLRRQVESLGEEPAVPPAEDITNTDTEVIPIPGPVGAEGDQGPRGLEGRPGRDGRDGQPCLPSNPQCVGPSGATGATGDQGPGPSAEQVAAAVAENCGGSCVGPSGADGADGADGATGPQGVGIADMDITPPNDDRECFLIVTLTDGSQRNAGQVDCPEPPLVPIG